MEDEQQSIEQMQMISLSSLFEEKNITEDMTLLKQAIINGLTFGEILDKYENYLSKQTIESIIGILNSSVVKEIKQRNQEKVNRDEDAQTIRQLQTIFKKETCLKHEFSDLKNALLHKYDIKKLMEFYDEELCGEQFNALKIVLQSNQIQQWKQKCIKKQKERKFRELLWPLNQIIDTEGIVNEILVGKNKQDILSEFKKNKKTLKYQKILQELLSSAQCHQLFQSQKKDQSQRYDLIKSLFSGMNKDVSQLINAVWKHDPHVSIVQQYNKQFNGKQRRQLAAIIESPVFQQILKKQQNNSVHQGSRTQQIQALFSSRNLKGNVQPLIEAILAKQDLAQILQTLRDDLTPKEMRIINEILKSQELEKLLVSDLEEEIDKQCQMSKMLNQQQEKIIKNFIGNQLHQCGAKSKAFLEKCLIKSIIQRKDFYEIYKKGQQSVLFKDRQIIQRIFDTKNIKLLLKKATIQNWSSKFNELMNIVEGISFNKHLLIEDILLGNNYNNTLDQIRKEQQPYHCIQFNHSIQSDNFRNFFEKYNIPRPKIIKKHFVHYQSTYFQIEDNQPLKKIRIKYDIFGIYKFFNQKGEIISDQLNLTEPMSVIKCQEIKIQFQSQTKTAFVPSNNSVKQAKGLIQNILKKDHERQQYQQSIDFQLIFLASKKDKTIAQDNASLMQICHGNKLYVSYWIELIIKIDDKHQKYQLKFMSHESVDQVKEKIAKAIGIKKQSQKWIVNEKAVYNKKESLEEIGIRMPQFILIVIEQKNLQYYGFDEITQSANQITRKRFYNFYIEDDNAFCENIKNSNFPADSYSEMFRKQVIGYIFSAIKKHSRIKTSLEHIKKLVVKAGKEDKLWISPRSKEKCFFNQTFVLYYILKNSESSLRSELIKGVSGNMPVPLLLNYQGRKINLFQEHYWIINKAFTILQFGAGDVSGKSDLLNILFEANFKNRDNMHNQCRGGMQIQYDIFKRHDYSVNIIDVSNDVDDQLKLELAKASNLINYCVQINEVLNGIQYFIRRNYELQYDRLWKFSDFLGGKTNQNLNQVLKQLQKYKDSLTYISNVFFNYKEKKDKQNQVEDYLQYSMKQKALQHGLNVPLRSIVGFYAHNFNYSAQIMMKVRLFLNFLRKDNFMEFNRLQQLLKDVQKDKWKKNFQLYRLQIVNTLKKIKQVNHSLTTSDVKTSIEQFFEKEEQFKSPKDWENIMKKIFNEFEYQIQPKAISVQNFWRELVYLSKYCPDYQFQYEGQKVNLRESLVSLRKNQISNSQNFEIINGDILQMSTQHLHKIFEQAETKKVMVVAIFGPQSSGKSTLLNFVFGCDFMSSVGRCTKGIYGTYFQILDRQIANCEAILIIDTEGLFSTYQNTKFANRQSFDNKIVHFCLQVCDLIILNTKGDLTKECLQILEFAYGQMVNNSILPELFFVLNLNGDDISLNQKNQIDKFCDKIIASNRNASSYVSRNNAAGLPMAFEYISRRSNAQFVNQFLKPKALPNARFYEQTKNLCSTIIEIFEKRGSQLSSGRTLDQIIQLMDKKWATMNKYPILTRYINKQISSLEEQVTRWKQREKDQFIRHISLYTLQLKVKKIHEIQQWGDITIKMLNNMIDDIREKYKSEFLPNQGSIHRITYLQQALISIQPLLHKQIGNFKISINEKKCEEQILQSEKKGFEQINLLIKIIKKENARQESSTNEKKRERFEKCWIKMEEELKKKINRQNISYECFESIMQMYNEELLLNSKNQKKVEIKAKFSKQQCQSPHFSYVKQLKQQFQKMFSRQDIFESSNKHPIMNIEETQGDLTCKYIKMSKYFDKKEIKAYVQYDNKKLRQCLDFQYINQQISTALAKSQHIVNDIDKLLKQFLAIGVLLKKQKLQKIMQKDYWKMKIAGLKINYKYLSRQDITLQGQSFKIISMNIRNNSNYFKNEFCKNLYIFQNCQHIFESQIKKLKTTLGQQTALKQIIIEVVSSIIDFYSKKEESQTEKLAKGVIQGRIIQIINQDLSKINLELYVSDNNFKQENISFKVMGSITPFKDITHVKNNFDSFSRYWKNSTLKQFKFNIKTRSTNSTFGYYMKKEIIVKGQYKDRLILQKYIKKQYNEFLKQINSPNFTQFIRDQLKYQSIFDEINVYADNEHLKDRQLKRSIQMLKNKTNCLIEEINNDLQQISQMVRYDFIAELHSYSFRLLWKIISQNQWDKKSKILKGFQERKTKQLQRLLNQTSGQPYLENKSCVDKIIQLYVQHINKLIKVEKEKHRKQREDIFKNTFTREYIQILIDKELNNQSLDEEDRQQNIYQYLLHPVDYLRKKCKTFYIQQTNKLSKQSFLQVYQLIQDLLGAVKQFKNVLQRQQDIESMLEFKEIQGQQKQMSYIPLIIDILNEKKSKQFEDNAQYQGKTFNIVNPVSHVINQSFLSLLLNKQFFITDLKIFTSIFTKQLQQLRKDWHSKINNRYNHEELQQFMLNILIDICTATCPCCNRICDVDMRVNPNHEQHQCEYGHQMRAIKGVRLQARKNTNTTYKASVKRCQDLENSSIFSFNGKDYTWQQFKLEKANKWNYEFIDKAKNFANFAYYWKMAGKRICNYYANRDNYPMEFLQYNRQNIKKASFLYPPTNYIFALDQSGSMQGQKWTELIEAIRENVKQISQRNQDENQTISVLTFNTKANLIIQSANPKNFDCTLLKYKGGGTDFSSPFKMGVQIITRRPQINHVFVFISDGSASYPDGQITQMKSLQQRTSSQGRKVAYVSIFIGKVNQKKNSWFKNASNDDSVMEKIREQLNGVHKTVANALNISQVFKEVLRQQQN